MKSTLKKSSAFTVGVMALALLAGSLTPAAAAPESGLNVVNTITVDPSQGLLVSPEELDARGFSGDEIKHQMNVIESLSVSEQDRQGELREEQSLIFPDLTPMLPVGQATGSQTSPRINTAPCSQSNDFYRVTTGDVSGSATCFANAGTWRVSSDAWPAACLRAGNNMGRIMYVWVDGLYWSTYRGPNDYNDYCFGGAVWGRYVEIV